MPQCQRVDGVHATTCKKMGRGFLGRASLSDPALMLILEAERYSQSGKVSKTVNSCVALLRRRRTCW